MDYRDLFAVVRIEAGVGIVDEHLFLHADYEYGACFSEKELFVPWVWWVGFVLESDAGGTPIVLHTHDKQDRHVVLHWLVEQDVEAVLKILRPLPDTRRVNYFTDLTAPGFDLTLSHLLRSPE